MKKYYLNDFRNFNIKIEMECPGNHILIEIVSNNVNK